MLGTTLCFNTLPNFCDRPLLDIFYEDRIAGWNTECMRLHGLFHIGDQVMQLGGLPVRCAKEFFKTLEFLDQEAHGVRVHCSLILRRLPHGKAFAIRRTYPGQSIGLRLENGTNQVRSSLFPLDLNNCQLRLYKDKTASQFYKAHISLYLPLSGTPRKIVLDPCGLVARNGLTVNSTGYRSDAPEGHGYQPSWTLTEINGQPLNVFGRKNEVSEHHSTSKRKSITPIA
ncbi:hypothetical protein FBUS_08722 [Fasciolopsis buskii]|uniref:Uncharacterized protein n=1 Tax=Fasciolopsis buskii TaxID=27845 RepID=A0A8E0RNQ4_9TREM|nr:hypothetical protein FBUS_08722 [Fasciolopsis buski]